MFIWGWTHALWKTNSVYVRVHACVFWSDKWHHILPQWRLSVAANLNSGLLNQDVVESKLRDLKVFFFIIIYLILFFFPDASQREGLNGPFDKKTAWSHPTQAWKQHAPPARQPNRLEEMRSWICSYYPMSQAPPSDWQWLSVRGYASVIPRNIFSACQCVGGRGRACPSKRRDASARISIIFHLSISRLTIKSASNGINGGSSYVCTPASVYLFFIVNVFFWLAFRSGHSNNIRWMSPSCFFCLFFFLGSSQSFNRRIGCEVAAKFQEDGTCWQVGWITIKAPATLRTWSGGTIWQFTGSARSASSSRSRAKSSLSIKGCGAFTRFPSDQKEEKRKFVSGCWNSLRLPGCILFSCLPCCCIVPQIFFDDTYSKLL